MNRAIFFSKVRGMFGRMTQSQVAGVENILDAGKGHPLSYVAYALATAFGETGGKMQPVEENLNYSESAILRNFNWHRRQGKTAKELSRNPKFLADTVYGGKWGAKNLGNTQPGDGYRYRGRGLPQVTGRSNYAKLSKKAGVDLVAEPSKMLDPAIAAKVSLFDAMAAGVYTGRKFADFLPQKGAATWAQFDDARAIINGRAKDDDKYADWAVRFQNALIDAGWADNPQVSVNFLGALLRALGWIK